MTKKSADITTEWVSLHVSDGTEMKVYVARPSSKGVAHPPGLLVIQEAFGVNSHIRDVTERFAREGYLAASPEVFHRTAKHGWEGSYTDFEAIKPHFLALTTEKLEADLRATYDYLKTQKCERVGSIGYCLGGRATFVANSLFPLDAAVSYYGGRINEMLDRAPKQHAPILLVWGGKDEHIGREVQNTVAAALRKAQKHFIDVEFGDADHGFFCDERAAYHEKSAKEAWALTTSFLENYLRA